MKFLKIQTVMSMTSLSRSSIYAAMAADAFPAQIKLGERSVAWLESDIQNWMENCINNRNNIWVVASAWNEWHVNFYYGLSVSAFAQKKNQRTLEDTLAYYNEQLLLRISIYNGSICSMPTSLGSLIKH